MEGLGQSKIHTSDTILLPKNQDNNNNGTGTKQQQQAVGGFRGAWGADGFGRIANDRLKCWRVNKKVE